MGICCGKQKKHNQLLVENESGSEARVVACGENASKADVTNVKIAQRSSQADGKDAVWLNEQDILSLKDRRQFFATVGDKEPPNHPPVAENPELIVSTDFTCGEKAGALRKTQPRIVTPSVIVPEIGSDGYFSREQRASLELERPRATPDRRGKNKKKILWKKGEVIGRGAFGMVSLALNEATGELMAVKEVMILNKSSTRNQQDLEALETEIELLSTLEHPNIVKYFGTERTPNHIYIFLEYVSGGSIQGLLQKFGKFTVSVVKIYTRQILQGLHFLHSRQIIHHDIKGANILCTAAGSCKLADFGASRTLQNLQGDSNMSMRGTVLWMAPEVIKQQAVGRQCDIWSIGCTIYEMLTGKPPYHNFGSQTAAMFNIASAKDPPPYPVNSQGEILVDKDGQEFLDACLQPDQNKRQTAHWLLNHAFVRGAPSAPAGEDLPLPDMSEPEVKSADENMMRPPRDDSYKAKRSISVGDLTELPNTTGQNPRRSPEHKYKAGKWRKSWSKASPPREDEHKTATEEARTESPPFTIVVEKDGTSTALLARPPPARDRRNRHRKTASRVDMARIQMELLRNVESQIQEQNNPEFKEPMVQKSSPQKQAQKYLNIIRGLNLDEANSGDLSREDSVEKKPVAKKRSSIHRAGKEIVKNGS